MPITNFKEKFDNVMKDCARGYQRCHECWALDCCDNLTSHELKRLENENKKLTEKVESYKEEIDELQTILLDYAERC